MIEEPEAFNISHSASAHDLQSFPAIARVLAAALPCAEVEHVGSTAVPGCLTKGDLDVLVRVDRPDFERSALALEDLLVSSTRNQQTAEYAEYDYSLAGVSASVQLVVAGSAIDDHFHRLKAILKSDPEALDRYNLLKVRHDGCDMGAYRREKERLIDSLLAADSTAREDSSDVVLRPGIYE